MLQISLAVEVEVLRFMTSYSVNGRTPTFRSTLSSQTFAADILRLVSAMSSNGTTSFEIFTAVVIQVLIFWVMTPWSFPCRWRQNGPPKLWYPTTKLHSCHNTEDVDLRQELSVCLVMYFWKYCNTSENICHSKFSIHNDVRTGERNRCLNISLIPSPCTIFYNLEPPELIMRDRHLKMV
jgi:hypothetical protein